MRAWQLHGGFGLDRLRLGEVPDPPAPGPGELGLRVLAASLNYRDLMMVRGEYNPRQPLPLVPGSDAVARVEAVGEGVEGFAPGDRVIPSFHQRWLAGPPLREHRRGTLGGPLQGVLRERMNARAAACVRAPAHLDDAAAATLPCAGVTAWRALFVEGGLRAGDTVLTLGTGGVSLFALQLARAAGARVIITSSSDEKLERARALGASLGINHARTPRWGRAVLEATGGEGVDLVVELGGAGTLQESLTAARVGGTIALIGVLSGAETPLNLTRVFMSALRVAGLFVGSARDLAALCRALEANPGLQPVVDAAFPFEELPRALDHLAAARHFGKLVVRVSPGS